MYFVGYILAILNLNLFYLVLSMNSILQDLEDSQARTPVDCQFALLRKYFKTSEVLSGYILAIRLSRQSADMEEQFLQHIYRDTEYAWTLMLLSNKFFENKEESKFVLDEKPMAYFSVNDISEDIREFTLTWQSSPNWNPDANFIIYLSYEEETEEILLDTFTDLIGRTLRTTTVLNLFAIGIAVQEDLVISVTFFPYHPNNLCGSLIEQIDIVDTCAYTSDDEFNIKQIKSAEYAEKYPKKLTGCSLSAAYRTLDPYIIQENSKENNTLNGLEYKLLEIVSQQLNMPINFVREENNIYLLYETLLNNEVDLIVGGLSQNPKLLVVSSTAAYYKDELTYCVAKGKTRRIYSILMSSHPILVLLLFLIPSIVKKLLRSLELFLNVRVIPPFNSQVLAIRVWALALGQSIKLPLMPLSGYLLILSGLLVTSILNTTIQSTLISRLTSEPEVDQIKSIKDIYDARMRITGPVEILYMLGKEGEVINLCLQLDFFLYDDDILQIYKYLRKSFYACHDMEKCLHDAAEMKDLAVVVSRQHLLFNPRIPRDKLYCFDNAENLYSVLITMYFPKNYYLLKRITPLILDVITVGLLQKWENDLKAHYGLYKKSSSLQRMFSLEDYSGALFLGGSMLLLALLVFQLELITYYVLKCTKFRCRIFKYMHSKIFDNSIKN